MDRWIEDSNTFTDTSYKGTLLYFLSLQLRDWLVDKMAASQDETYRDAKNLHSKYMRHQAFESEIAANKDRLNRVQQVSDTTTLIGPHLSVCVCVCVSVCESECVSE